MDKTQSVLQFVGYDVQKISVERFETEEQDDNEQLTVSNKLERVVREKNENQFMLVMTTTIKGEDKKGNTIFDIRAKVRGFFYCEDGDYKSWIDNATAILYPYIRCLITTVTSNSGMAPLILPTVNVVEMFKDAKDDTE